MVRCHATMHLTMGIAFGTLCFDKASNAGVQLVTHQKIEKSKNQMQFFTHISLCGSAGLITITITIIIINNPQFFHFLFSIFHFLSFNFFGGGLLI